MRIICFLGGYMIYLSDSAIRYAVLLCMEKEHYRIHIATFSKVGAGIWFSKIKELKEYDKNKVRRATLMYDENGLIEFTNGSTIRISAPKESCRGQRCHLLIVDDGIKEDVIRNVLKPCETLDYKETLLVELVNNVIDSLNRIKRIRSENKIIIETKTNTEWCRIGEAQISTSNCGDIVFNVKRINKLEEDWL